MNYTNKKLLAIIIGGVFVAALAAGTWYFGNREVNDPNIAAIVNGEKITKEQVKQRAWLGAGMPGQLNDYSVNAEESTNALDSLIEATLLTQEASKLGISVSEVELENKIKESSVWPLSYEEPRRSMVFNAQKAELLRQKIGDKVTTWRKGEYLLVLFDRWYKDNPSQYARDKEYALQLASQYYSQIQNGSITFAEAADKLKTDPRLGNLVRDTSNWQHSSFGGSFGRWGTDIEEYIPTTLVVGLKDYVDGLSIGELQRPKVMEVHLPHLLRDDISEGEKAEGVWLVVRIDEENQGTHKTFRDWLNGVESRSDIRRYI